MRYLLLILLCSMSSLATAGKFWNMVFTPKDFYTQQCKTELRSSNEPQKFSCNVTHKYPGRYLVNLYVTGSAKPHQRYEFSPNIDVSITQEGKTIALKRANDTSWLFDGMHGKGVVLFGYEVPELVKEGITCQLNIKVNNIQEALPKDFGNVYLTLDKTDDM